MLSFFQNKSNRFLSLTNAYTDIGIRVHELSAWIRRVATIRQGIRIIVDHLKLRTSF